MIPATRVAVQHRGGFPDLPPVRPAAFAAERVVRVGARRRLELEQFAQRVEREVALDVFGRVDDAGREGLLVGLALEDLLLDRAGRDEAVHEAVFLLAVAPDARQGLLVGGRVPVRVEEHEAVRADEVQAASAGFTAEEEDKLRAVGVVEFVDEFLTFVDVHRAVETEDAVVAAAAEPVEHVERLRVVADEHDFIVGVLPDSRQHAVEDLHLSRVPRPDVAIAASGFSGDIVVREEFFAPREIGGGVEEIGVIAELLQHPDGFEGLRALAAEEGFDVGRLNKVVVEVHLEG